MIARELEDVAAVVNAVAHEVGALVSVYGHSHGGIDAFGCCQAFLEIEHRTLRPCRAGTVREEVSGLGGRAVPVGLATC